jgi:uncharacterized protein YbjQ (UPF0145 family)
MSTDPRLTGLPPAAEDRLTTAARSGVWSSGMPVGEDGLLRAVGLTPVGVVTASVPSWPFRYQYPRSIVGLTESQRSRLGPNADYQRQLIDDPIAARRLGGFVRDYAKDAKGGLLSGFGWSWQRVIFELRERQRFDAAMDQLRTEAQVLGAHGIIAVNAVWIPRPSLSSTELDVNELRITGTAVVAHGVPEPTRLFTTTASGADVAQLLRSGIAPSETILGVGIVCAEVGPSASRQLRSLGIGEVEQFSDALDRSLTLALADLERRAAPFGDLVIGASPSYVFAHSEAHTRVLGTAARRFAVHDGAPPIPMMTLGPTP